MSSPHDLTHGLAHDLTHVAVDGGAVPTHVVGPTDGPAIVLVQEIFGVSPYILRRADDLAALGYRVWAPEVYWRLDDVVIDESSDQVLAQAMATANRLDWPQAVTDVTAVVRAARGEDTSHPVALVGFCFGGGLAFNVAAVEPVDALVSYYGSALPNLLGLADRVTVPSLHHFGDHDDFIPLDTVERVRAAVVHGPQIEFHLYPDANHAFDGPIPALHDDAASTLAWERTVDFLGRVLPVR